jgi:PPOX class probable F420-dependent enzyme
VGLTEQQLAFLGQHHSAAMATLRPDGSPHVVWVGAAVVDGKVWSSGTQDRVRTRHLRRDPRATLWVFDPAWRGLALDATVTILEGAEVPGQSLRLFQTMQRRLDPGPAPGMLLWEGTERTHEEFLQIMVAERRLIYQFEVSRAYGLF